MPSKLAERLAVKIYKDTGLEVDPSTLSRTRAGRNLKSQGAWVWQILDKNSHKYIGGCEAVSEMVKSKYKLSIFRDWGDVEIVNDLIKEE